MIVFAHYEVKSIKLLFDFVLTAEPVPSDTQVMSVKSQSHGPPGIFTYSPDNNSHCVLAGFLQCPPPRSHILCHRYPAPGRADISLRRLKDKPLC